MRVRTRTVATVPSDLGAPVCAASASRAIVSELDDQTVRGGDQPCRKVVSIPHLAQERRPHGDTARHEPTQVRPDDAPEAEHPTEEGIRPPAHRHAHGVLWARRVDGTGGKGRA